MVLFVLHVASVKTNPADPGESALWFLLLTLPWAYLLPEALTDAPWWDRVAYGAGWLLAPVNAFFICCLTGGLGFGRGKPPG